MSNYTLWFDGLVQDCSNSSAVAMELLQSCTEPLSFMWINDLVQLVMETLQSCSKPSIYTVSLPLINTGLAKLP